MRSTSETNGAALIRARSVRGRAAPPAGASHSQQHVGDRRDRNHVDAVGVASISRAFSAGRTIARIDAARAHRVSPPRADRAYLAGQRHFARDGDVLRQRRLRERRVEGEEERQTREGPSMLPPPITLTCRSKSLGSRPLIARTTDAALNTESRDIEPAVSLKRTVPLRGSRAGNAAASISMIEPTYCSTPSVHAADLFLLAHARRCAAHDAAGLDDEITSSSRTIAPWQPAHLGVERVTVGVGKNLDRFAAFVRIRGDERRTVFVVRAPRRFEPLARCAKSGLA